LIENVRLLSTFLFIEKIEGLEKPEVRSPKSEVGSKKVGSKKVNELKEKNIEYREKNIDFS